MAWNFLELWERISSLKKPTARGSVASFNLYKTTKPANFQLIEIWTNSVSLATASSATNHQFMMRANEKILTTIIISK